MKRTLGIFCTALMMFGCVFLTSCATYKASSQVVFDLGELPPAHHNAGLPAMEVAEPNVPPWLDSFEMYYRLSYANDHQVRPYTNSRWSMPPLQLFEQRLKASIAEAGGQVLSSTECCTSTPTISRRYSIAPSTATGKSACGSRYSICATWWRKRLFPGKPARPAAMPPAAPRRSRPLVMQRLPISCNGCPS